MKWTQRKEETTYSQHFHAEVLDGYLTDNGHIAQPLFPSGVSSDVHQVTLDGITFDSLEIDQGFDFRLPQQSGDVLIGWLDEPSEEEWPPSLSLPRKCSIDNGRLMQRPHPSLEVLRGQKEQALGYATKKPVKLRPYSATRFELIVEILDNESSEFILELRASKKEMTMLSYRQETREFILNRAESSMAFIDEETERHLEMDMPLEKIHIFVDTSSIEIFLNDGAYVLSSRIFPDISADEIRTSTESGQVYLRMTKYDMTTA